MASQKESRGERRLGAIMFTDVVGYSAMAARNEDRALHLLDEHRALLKAVFSRFNGRVVKSTGDGFLVEFVSAVEAVNCSVETQREMGGFNRNKGPDEKLQVRIGIHVGDIVHSEGDVLGDAVNVAARVQPLAEAGGVCVTRQVVDQVERKVEYKMVKIGTRELKNIGHPVELYRVVLTSENPREGSILDPRRVAILPFTNMSADPNDRYFAEGMTEELISTVSKIGELGVISRTSVMKYKDAAVPVSQIGEELSVGTVLEGSVRKAGNRVRITAQLIDVGSDRHLWVQSYDRDLTDVFAIQSDIAEQVADSLKVQLLSSEKERIRKKATADPEAHTLYLKGRYYWSERTEDGTKKALKYFEEATKVDPEFALAYSGMADCYNILSDYGWLPPHEAGPLARMNALKALEIDDSLAEAHASLGLALENYSWDFVASERELKRAIELNPNYAPAHHWYGTLLFFMRSYGEADASGQRALELDPYSRVYNMTRATRLLINGKPVEATKGYNELVGMYPDFPALHFWKSQAHMVMGEFEKAIEEAMKFLKAENESWGSKLFLAWAYAAAGMREEAEKLVDQAIAARDRAFVSSASSQIGLVKLTLGQKDEGYEWLRKAYEEHDPNLLYFNGLPWTAEFRSDPRWAEIESKLDFPKH